MFGTVARMKVLPGREQEFIDYGKRWAAEKGNENGEVAGYLVKLEGKSDEFMMLAVFRDRESYFQNAHDPGTDRYYQGMRKLLQSDPEWNDGEILDLPVLAGI